MEGPGDKDAVPELLRRILWERLDRYDVLASQAIAANGKPNLIRNLKRFLRYAVIKRCDAILVVLDADRDCPRNLALNLAVEASALNLNVPVAIVCCRHEYETWFICNLTDTNGDGIRNRLALSSSLTGPTDVETLSGAKQWLTHHMPGDRIYKETSDQVNLTHQIDLTLTHDRSRSFRRMCHAVEELIRATDKYVSNITPHS